MTREIELNSLSLRAGHWMMNCVYITRSIYSCLAVCLSVFLLFVLLLCCHSTIALKLILLRYSSRWWWWSLRCHYNWRQARNDGWLRLFAASVGDLVAYCWIVIQTKQDFPSCEWEYYSSPPVFFMFLFLSYCLFCSPSWTNCRWSCLALLFLSSSSHLGKPGNTHLKY